MSGLRLVTILGFLSVPAPVIARSDPPPSGSDRAGYVAVPLEPNRRGGHVWVRAETGGHALLLVVDTGAPNTSLDLATARRLGLKLSPGIEAPTAIDAKLSFQIAELPDLRVGSVRRSRTPILVADWSPIVRRLKEVYGVDIDGILGADLLDAYGAVIDYRTRTLYLYDPAAPDLERLQGGWVGTTAVLAGDPAPDPESVRAARLTVRGVSYRYEAGGTILTGVIQLSPTTHQFTLTDVLIDGRPTPTGPGRVVGLYGLNSDILTLAWPCAGKPLDAKDFPKEPVSTRENGMMLVRFSRVPVEVAPPPRAVLRSQLIIPRSR